jgi:Cof subfamily protein (haloacid dehalogenase superfamily)
MANNIKLLALDIDGTIMDTDYLIKEPVKKIIKRVQEETNIIIVLASGRMTHSTKIVADELGITTIAIVYQGAMVRDFSNNKILYHKTLDPDCSLKVIEDIENENIHVNIYIDDNLYMKQESEIARQYTSNRNLQAHIIKDYSLLQHNPPTKLLALDRDTERLQKLKQVWRRKFNNKMSIFSSRDIYVEFVHKEVNKGKSLYEFARQHFNIDPTEIMAVGDGENDLEMIRDAGLGIAMGNAVDEVKQVAKHITSPVDQNGLVEAIESFIFNGAR